MKHPHLSGLHCTPGGLKVVVCSHCLIKEMVVDGVLRGFQEQAVRKHPSQGDCPLLCCTADCLQLILARYI